MLTIKEESKKRFILDSGSVPSATEVPDNHLKISPEELAKLTEENKLLKDRLSRILAFVKQR